MYGIMSGRTSSVSKSAFVFVARYHYYLASSALQLKVCTVRPKRVGAWAVWVSPRTLYATPRVIYPAPVDYCGIDQLCRSAD